MNETFEQCRKNLLRRGFEVRIAATTEEARQILREEIRATAPETISFGGSMTMAATGIVDELRREGRYRLFDGVDYTLPPEERIRTIAAPQNIARHPGFRTPCAVTGVCADCYSEDRICNTHLRMERCFPRKRITVVLIDEDLGL